ncbi:putative oxidoreductase YyaE [Alicyclobacillus contaminans]|uniref:molybdopterin-dependent oxidoreductase n=1 Tax=Alicyclobacillus contaminans TaxID=392016 RepID=UPI000420017E|nr:molybdopterin-dependent oxidoreductase [Alicyclobacillus contaminans]GMA50763.1 putative oxidoreductase YyaE [Alicyclobacillus contaminans]
MIVKTACPLDCWDACSMLAEVEDGAIRRLSGDPNHPVTQGFICNKGSRLKDRRDHPDRIVHPLKKVEGQWQPVSWDEALDEIAGLVREVLDRHGHHAILHAYDWGSGTVLKNLNQRFFYLLGGCSETVGSLCWDAGIEAQRYDFGQARSHAPNDLCNARGIVVWGRNASVTNIHLIPFLKRALKDGARLAVVNPLPIELGERAELVVAPRPGSDALLALGVLKLCKAQGWVDEAFVQQWSIGWPELSAYLDELSLDDVVSGTDVPLSQLNALAAFYGCQKPVSTILGLGMQRYPGGGNAIRAIDALAAATGHVGVPGGGVQYANRQMTEFLNEEAIANRSAANVRTFSRGQQASEIRSANPPVELMFVTRTNPAVQVPDTARLVEAYRSIRSIVAIDQFMTKTAELADYFLPCTNVLEEEDFVFSTMWHPYVTYIHPVLPPRGEAKPDWWIFAELADRLGFGSEMRRPLDAWMEAVLEPLKPYGVTLDTLKERGTIRLPLPDVPWQDRQFATPSGKFEFVSARAQAEGHSAHAVYIPPQEIGRGRHPYALLTIHPRVSENSQHRLAPNLPHIPSLDVPPAVAEQTGVQHGGLARLFNDRAELIVRVQIREGGHPRAVKLESGWWGQGITVNHFTSVRSADLGDQTAQYDCAVSLEPVVDAEGLAR